MDHVSGDAEKTSRRIGPERSVDGSLEAVSLTKEKLEIFMSRKYTYENADRQWPTLLDLRARHFGGPRSRIDVVILRAGNKVPKLEQICTSTIAVIFKGSTPR